jgi:hypothetical protein
MAPTEKVATASRLEARIVRISSTDSPPSRSAMSSGTTPSPMDASRAAPTPSAA